MCFLGLVAMLHASVVIHAIHPLFHPFRELTQTSQCVSSLGIDVSRCILSFTEKKFESCPVCNFLLHFHAPGLPTVPFRMAFVVLVALAAPPTVMYRAIRVLSPLPRAPPLR